MGGPQDASYIGAAWVYTRSGGVWSQQGRKLTAINAGTNAGLGWSVALSADGNTAIVGGPNGQTGAAWVFIRNGNVWSQQGGKLVANDAAGPTFQGNSVALSADGDTAIVGGFYDNAGTGATWVYTRSGGVWSQQGRKLVGTNAVGNAQQGYSVALSADGNTAIVGGPNGQSRGGVGLCPAITTNNKGSTTRAATLTINPPAPLEKEVKSQAAIKPRASE